MKKALLFGLIVLFFSSNSLVYAATTYYEVWRSETSDPRTAVRLQAWLGTTNYDDSNGVPGTHYYYWIRVVTAETASAFVNNPNYGPFTIAITCPTAAQRSDSYPIVTTSPIKVGLLLGDPDHYLNVTNNMYCAVKEADVFSDDTMAYWREPSVTPNGWTVTRTVDVDISLWESSSTAEVYFYAKYEDPSFAPFYLTLYTSNTPINVALRDYSDPAPSNISASQGTYSDKVHVTWSAASGNSDLTAAAMGWKAISSGSLNVTIEPSGARSAGAQWRVDGGSWHNSGDTQSGLSADQHTVEFSTITGWNAPATQNVQINPNQTTSITGTYSTGGTESKTLTSVADTYISQYHHTVSYGTSNIMWVGFVDSSYDSWIVKIQSFHNSSRKHNYIC